MIKNVINSIIIFNINMFQQLRERREETKNEKRNSLNSRIDCVCNTNTLILFGIHTYLFSINKIKKKNENIYKSYNTYIYVQKYFIFIQADVKMCVAFF